jgi:hypothetical protein
MEAVRQYKACGDLAASLGAEEEEEKPLTTLKRTLMDAVAYFSRISESLKISNVKHKKKDKQEKKRKRNLFPPRLPSCS